MFLKWISLSPQGLIQEISDLRYRVNEMEDERLQYEKKLKSNKVRFPLCSVDLRYRVLMCSHAP